VIKSVCCQWCGTRVEVQTYTDVEKVLCPGCQKIEEQREVLDQVDCSKCKDRICEKEK